MDIHCERCRAAYVLEDEQVTAAGVALQCSNCGYLFEVKRKVVFVTTPLRPEQAAGALRLAPPPPRAVPPPPIAPPAAVGGPPAASTPRRPAVPATAARIDPPPAFGAGEVDLGRPPSTSLQRSRLPQLLVALVLTAAAGLGAKVLWDRTRGDIDLFGREAAPPEPDGTSPAPPEGAAPAPAPEGGAASPAPGAALPAQPAPTPSGAPAAPGPGAAESPSAPAQPPAGGGPGEVATPAPAAPPASEPAPAQPSPAPAEAPATAAPAPSAPRAPATALAEAGRLRNRGQIARALELYRGVLAQEPENVAALTGQGLCYLDLARYPSAETSFQAALRAAPADPDATLGLAETYRWQGNDAEAIRYYERYLAEHPDGEEAAVARNAIDALRR